MTEKKIHQTTMSDNKKSHDIKMVVFH